MSQPPVSQPVPAPARKSILFGWWPKVGKWEKRGRSLAAVLVWSYLVLNTFVFDIDQEVKVLLPASLTFIITYKLFFILAGAGLLIAFVSGARVAMWSVYITLYPISRFFLYALVVIFVIIKARSWPLTFSALNLILSFFQSLKINFEIFCAVVVCSAVIILSHWSPSLFSAVAILVLVALVIVVRGFISLFRPSRLIRAYLPIMSWLARFTRNQARPFPAPDPNKTEEENSKAVKQWADGLHNAVTLRLLCEYLSFQFIAFRKSSLPILYYALNFFSRLILVLYLFTMANEGLFKADTASFAIAHGHSAFDFVYYTFCMFVGHGSPSIVAQSIPAEVTMMIATLVALLMLGMFISIYFAHKRTLDDADIEEVANSLKKQARSIDEFMTEKYSLSFDAAIQRLDELQKSVAVFITMVKAVQRPDDHS